MIPRRTTATALLAVAAVGLTSLVVRPADGASVPGSAGTDTAIAPTSSQRVVHGRGTFSNLSITINQTAQLSNQAVSVSWTGGRPTTSGGGGIFHGDYLQMMQCWGDDDGTHPENPGPPPEQCEAGATDGVYGGRNSGVFPPGSYALERIISRTFWPDYDPHVGYTAPDGVVWRPFRPVDGSETIDAQEDFDFNPAIEGGSYWLNPWFNSITTNEISGSRTAPDGTGSDLFEVQTGLEASGLGCGQKVQPAPGGGTKVPKCWLVIVPRGTPAQENVGSPFEQSADQSGVAVSPLAEGTWANRIAVPLDFNPLSSSCNLADEQRRIAGSELVLGAISSWQPALCANTKLKPFAYGSVGDEEARQQLLAGVPGGPGMIAVSNPVDSTFLSPANPVVYAPLTVSSTVIGFNVERSAKVGAPDAEVDLQGIRVAHINLTPRLVAKLLTQSYTQQTAILTPSPYAWARANPSNVTKDPDFLRFNPEFELLDTQGLKNMGGFVMPARDSDAAREVWEWVLSDAEARAWLDGDPDEWGTIVNPVYATRAGANSTGAAFGSPAPESFPKSDPYCYQAPPQGPTNSVTPPPLCGTDWLPYTQSNRDAAHNVRIANDGAKIVRNPFAISVDRVYGSSGSQVVGSRAMLGLTDSAAAYQYGLQTARLSRSGDDGAGRAFIAPDVAGMTAGVAAMSKGREGLLSTNPSTTAAKAYPLTMVTYGAVAPAGLDSGSRTDFAALIDYARGNGQKVGAELGQLPPGYAPLTASLSAQAKDAAATIRGYVPPDGTPGATPESPTDFPSTPLDSGFTSESQTSDFVTDESSTPVAPPSATAPGEETPVGGTGAMTAVVAITRSRFVLPALGLVCLAAAMGALEITKRPRRAASRSGS